MLVRLSDRRPVSRSRRQTRRPLTASPGKHFGLAAPSIAATCFGSAQLRKTAAVVRRTVDCGENHRNRQAAQRNQFDHCHHYTRALSFRCACDATTFTDRQSEHVRCSPQKRFRCIGPEQRAIIALPCVGRYEQTGGSRNGAAARRPMWIVGWSGGNCGTWPSQLRQSGRDHTSPRVVALAAQMSRPQIGADSPRAEMPQRTSANNARASR